MAIGMTQTFRLPEGWTMRKVAKAMAREWLPPLFWSESSAKKGRWVVQSVVVDNRKPQTPLWEAGISTEEYEERLERAGLSWVIRATFGRNVGRGAVLARFVRSQHQATTFQIESSPDAFPETLFDSEKLDQFLQSQGADGVDELFNLLLASNGFQSVAL